MLVVERVDVNMKWRQQSYGEQRLYWVVIQEVGVPRMKRVTQTRGHDMEGDRGVYCLYTKHWSLQLAILNIFFVLYQFDKLYITTLYSCIFFAKYFLSNNLISYWISLLLFSSLKNVRNYINHFKNKFLILAFRNFNKKYSIFDRSISDKYY